MRGGDRHSRSLSAGGAGPKTFRLPIKAGLPFIMETPSGIDALRGAPATDGAAILRRSRQAYAQPRPARSPRQPPRGRPAIYNRSY
jgi:hypothetical protein